MATYFTFLSDLRRDFAKAVLPAVTEIYLKKDFAEPHKMIAQTSWNIANELAEIELKHQTEEEKKDDGKD